MDIIKLLDGARERCDVLEHPFYLRWTAGELTATELSSYAAQYRHAVVALADATEAAAASAEADPASPAAAGLRTHAKEEREHVDLWDEFAAAAADRAEADRSHTSDADATPGRGRSTRDPLSAALPQTVACVEAWTAGDDLLERLAVLYAIEASQPAISKTKLSGLEHHYGFESGSRGTTYFKLHSTRDHEHAREAGDSLQRLAHEDDAPRLLRRAEAALAGNWTLLDGVEADLLAAA